MANYFRTPNYREMYPDASEEVIQCLRKGYRKMQYTEYDLKVEKFAVDSKKQTVTFVPAREDSLNRRIDEGEQFEYAAESVEDAVTQKLMIAKMMDCVQLLSDDEKELIVELFFQKKSQRNLCQKYGISQPAIKKRLDKILAKLKKMIEI